MKTYNNHPQWYNKPIRLNEEQTNNPTPVFDEFFQCYHLDEVRQTMWRWLVMVVSSAGSVSNDPHERNNDLYFYEQIEMLVEGVWVMRREGKATVPVCSEPCIEEWAISNTRFSKPPRLIEKVHSQPEEVIREVFSEVTLGDLFEDLLPAWLRVALVNSDGPYSDGDGHEILHEFYDQLLMFIEALYVIYDVPAGYNAYCLSMEQLADPGRWLPLSFNSLLLNIYDGSYMIFWMLVLDMLVCILMALRHGRLGWFMGRWRVWWRGRGGYIGTTKSSLVQLLCCMKKMMVVFSSYKKLKCILMLWNRKRINQPNW